jgi:hypothetical protein
MAKVAQQVGQFGNAVGSATLMLLSEAPQPGQSPTTVDFAPDFAGTGRLRPRESPDSSTVVGVSPRPTLPQSVTPHFGPHDSFHPATKPWVTLQSLVHGVQRDGALFRSDGKASPEPTHSRTWREALEDLGSGDPPS